MGLGGESLTSIREKIKIRAEINEVETKKAIERFNETLRNSPWKRKQSGKPFARLAYKIRNKEKLQIISQRYKGL